MKPSVKSDFPIFDNSDLVYLDNASTTQKPQQVLDAIQSMYSKTNANVHRALYDIGSEATEKFENSRKKVSNFIRSESESEIIFTGGTTESINLLAHSLGNKLGPGDDILVSEMEHHANLVPWQMACRRTGANLKFIPMNENGDLDLTNLETTFTDSTKIISITHVSNVLGTINPINEIAKIANEIGAIFIVDGAQGVPHQSIDVKKLGCDFYVFSGHKMLAPTGVGVLWGKIEKLEDMDPFMGGGEMIETVTMESSTWNKVPYKFEAGTPNFVQAVGLGAAIDYLNDLGMDEVFEHENNSAIYEISEKDYLTQRADKLEEQFNRARENASHNDAPERASDYYDSPEFDMENSAPEEQLPEDEPQTKEKETSKPKTDITKPPFKKKNNPGTVKTTNSWVDPKYKGKTKNTWLF